jgi:hypothetical protein
MKTKTVLMLSVICMTLFSFITINQDLKTEVVIYDGYEYEMYNFSIPEGDDQPDVIITFDDIPDDIQKMFDLKSDNLIGESFEISYEIVLENDVLGEEESEESNILKSLKKVQK